MPVDVIRTEDFTSQGSTDLANQLRTVVPSFNVSIQPISDAATIVRPANLRNLAPDHTLILVNGKRRHRAAVITWLGNGIADGSQGPDLSVIPSIAIRQAEVLRDGAAAQYGSDAIAGVMNFQLKDSRSGGSLEFRTGAYRNANPGSPSTCGAGIIGDIQHSCNGIGGHGQAFTFAGNVGLPLGENGFANLSMEYGEGAPTSRSVQRLGAQSIIAAGNTNLRNPAQIWGSPEVDGDLKLFGNFGHLFESGNQFYAHTNFAKRTVTGGFYFRNPHTRGGVFRGHRLHPISRLNVYDKDGKFTNFPDPNELDTEESDHRDAIVYDANDQVASLPGQAGIPSLLVGDRVWAETDVQEAGGCATIPVINHVPDAAALQQVEADPNCFTLYSRFPAVSRRNSAATSSIIRWSADCAGSRTTAVSPGTRASASAPASRSVHLRYGQRVARLRHADVVRARHLPAGRAQPQLRRPVRGQRHRARCGRHGVAPREVHDRRGRGSLVGYRPVRRAGLQLRFERLQRLPGRHDGGSWSRSNVAAYGDLEFSAPDGQWTLGTALRLERFQ